MPPPPPPPVAPVAGRLKLAGQSPQRLGGGDVGGHKQESALKPRSCGPRWPCRSRGGGPGLCPRCRWGSECLGGHLSEWLYFPPKPKKKRWKPVPKARAIAGGVWKQVTLLSPGTSFVPLGFTGRGQAAMTTDGVLWVRLSFICVSCSQL